MLKGDEGEVKTQIWIEDGEILCCSSMCRGCEREFICSPVPDELVKNLLKVVIGNAPDSD